MKRALLLVLSFTLLSPAWAADKPAKKPTAASTKSRQTQSADNELSSDIIGSQEAPLEMNFVPWHDKEAYLPKNALEASVLQENLEPLDKDVVQREVDYARILQAPNP